MLKMMGMTEGAHIASWLITQFALALCSIGVVIAILFGGKVIANSSNFVI